MLRLSYFFIYPQLFLICASAHNIRSIQSDPQVSISSNVVSPPFTSELNSQSESLKNGSMSSGNTTASTITPTTANSTNSSCTSTQNEFSAVNLKKFLSEISRDLNSSEHLPCEDFYHFTCQKWIDNNPIPDDKTSFDQFIVLREDLQEKIIDVLNESNKAANESLELIQYGRDIYKACMDEDQINKLGTQPFINYLKRMNFTWPMLSDDFSEENYDWFEDVISLRQTGYDLLISMGVGVDVRNSTNHAVVLDQTSLGRSRDQLLKERNDTKMIAYVEYMNELITHLGGGGGGKNLSQDIEDMLAFEVQLANLTALAEERRDSERMYNKLPVTQLIENYPFFRWLEYFNRTLPKQVNFTSSDFVLVRELEYFKKLPVLIQQTPKRVIANYIGWRVAKSLAWHLDQEVREIRFKYVKIVAGVKSEQDRWKSCIGIVQDNFDIIIGRLFVDKYFTGENRLSAQKMTKRILDEFKIIIEETEWMEEVDKVVALEKVEKMEVRIGFPDYLYNDTKMREEFEGFIGRPDDHLGNLISNMKAADISNMKKLREEVDRTKWGANPATINAFYNMVYNTITFPAAFLQPPLYSVQFPAALNYGGIGSVIAHEVTHAFDSEGRKYDVQGNLKVWWSNSTTERYEELSECFVNQYNGYYVSEVNMTVNGKLTLTENIADNGGIRAAFRAFKKHLKENPQEANHTIAGFEHYTQEQLFFIAYGRLWCGSDRPETLEVRLENGYHSLEEFRALGPLSNLPQFQETWQCKNESAMAPLPENRCKIW